MPYSLTVPTSTEEGQVPVWNNATARFDYYPFNGRATFSNANYTVLPKDRTIVQIGTLSAARVVTLPAANAVPPGTRLRLVDESGTIGGAWNLSWARSGTDTINNGTANVIGVAIANGASVAVSDGVSKWTVAVDYIQPGRVTFSNADFTAVSTNRIVAQVGTMSALRTVTLPAASAVLPGTMIDLVDESGTTSPSLYVIVQRAGGDTLLWGYASPASVTTFVAIDAPYGSCQLMSDGSSKWFLTRYSNPGGWVAPTLLNSWVNYGSSNVDAAYRKVNDQVQIRGVVKNGVTTSGTSILTLPAGYRPLQQIVVPTIDGNNALGRFDITTAGAVIIQVGANNAFGITTQFSVL